MKIILIYYKLLMKIPTPSIRELKTNYNYLQKKKRKNDDAKNDQKD